MKLIVDAVRGVQDVVVSDVFTEDMFEELYASMEKEGWKGIDETKVSNAMCHSMQPLNFSRLWCKLYHSA